MQRSLIQLSYLSDLSPSLFPKIYNWLENRISMLRNNRPSNGVLEKGGDGSVKKRMSFQKDFFTRNSRRYRFTLEEEMSLQSYEYPTNIYTYLNERSLTDHPENE